jgi:hypothetical protein
MPIRPPAAAAAANPAVPPDPAAAAVAAAVAADPGAAAASDSERAAIRAIYKQVLEHAMRSSIDEKQEATFAAKPEVNQCHWWTEARSGVCSPSASSSPLLSAPPPPPPSPPPRGFRAASLTG